MADTLRVLALNLLSKLLPEDDRSGEAQFLRAGGETGSLRACIAKPAEADAALVRLAKELALNDVEILSVAIALAVETDPPFNRAVAHLQNPVGGSRPIFGLLSAALAPLSSGADVVASILTGPAIGSGLLQITNENAPLTEQAVFVPIPLCVALTGSNTGDYREVTWPGIRQTAAGSSEIPLPPSVRAEAARHARALAGLGGNGALVLRSGSPAEARAVAAEIARRMNCRAFFLDETSDSRREKHEPAVPPGLGPWLILHRMIPVFGYELGPGERRNLPALPHYHGPRLATCGPEGTIEAAGETVAGWTIPIPSKAERIRLWETAVSSRSMARSLAVHRHGSGRIAHLGKLARYRCALENRSRLQIDDIVAASWTTEGAGMESLAQPLTYRIPDEALVTTGALRGELERLLLRCCGREDLVNGLGLSASTRYRPGVRALFCGPSGTGKTLAAGWIATQLGLPLYRVDLASVTSKYIGETEKNLAQLLARAEHAELVLLFDEADSMFGKRTDVKESNDRFANAQTNYLLQRIESFDGIVLLTSNSQSRFDPAFFRRLDAIVEFPVPGPSERRALWQAHIGEGHSLTPREMNQLAAAVDLHGGNIRNAVLTAAVLSRAGSRPIAYNDVLEGLTDEYRKHGRQLPAELRRIG